MISDGIKLIVGLGNPGLVYAGSRHNIGFTVVKSLAGSLKISFKRDRFVSALVGQGKLSERSLVLALPQTYMNLSGIAVKALIKKFKIGLKDLLVVCDDLDLEPGRMRIRPGGSSGGQRGIKSIIEHLGSDDFCRLRVGIGRPPDPKDASDYVLSAFLPKEKKVLKQSQEDAVACCSSWIEDGIVIAMNKFNPR